MKGFTNIKLYDVHGNIVQDQDDNNMITDGLENMLKTIVDMAASPRSFISEAVRDQLSNKCLLDYIGGIMLFEDTIPGDSSVTSTIQAPVATAGRKYDYTLPKIGSLNNIETGEVEVGGKVGYRWVWDFGTANGNCTFNSICLTTRHAGDGLRFPLQPRSDYGLSVKDDYGILNHIPGLVISSKGKITWKSNNEIKTYKFKDSKTIRDTTMTYEAKVVSIGNMDKLTNPNNIFNDEIHLIGIDKTNDLNEYKLVIINANTHEMISTETLIGFKEKYNALSLEHFGYCDSNSIATNFRGSGNNFLYDVYDRDTHKFIERTVDIGISSPSVTGFRVTSIQCEDESYATLAFVPENANYPDFYSIIKISKIAARAWRNAELGWPYVATPALFFNNNMAIFAGTGNNAISRSDEQTLFFTNPEPLFTINNLDAPVTKTEANTMKISYTILY